jgi:hypothetical protein
MADAIAGDAIVHPARRAARGCPRRSSGRRSVRRPRDRGGRPRAGAVRGARARGGRGPSGVDREVASGMVTRVGHQHAPGEQAACTHLPRDRLRALERIVAADVAVDDQEGLAAEQRQRMRDAAGRLERGRRGRPSNAQPPARPVAQRALELHAEMGMVDDDLAHAGARKRLEMPDDQRLAARLEQGLRAVVRERTHPFAAAGRENHGAHGLRGHRARLPSTWSIKRARPAKAL